MSKRPVEINPIRSERLKQILERENVTQQRLAELIFQTQQNISRIMQKKQSLTEETAKAIIDVFPDYRIEWLLGYDDVMLVTDLLSNEFNKRDRIADGIWGMIELSLNPKGKSLRFCHPQGLHYGSFTRRFHNCHYSIVDNNENEIKRISVKDMIQLEEKMIEYCDFLVSKYL